jgi:uncharacterized membrane protein YdfJ with MMPL/SSD domain
MPKDPKARPLRMPKDIYESVMATVRRQHAEERIGSVVRRRPGRVLVMSVAGTILLETDYKKARSSL